MSKIFKLIVAFAALAVLAQGAVTVTTASSASLTAASFYGSVAPSKVFDYTVTADETTWATYNYAKFGPGATAADGLVYAYGWLFNSGSLTKIASRAITAYLIGNGTAPGATDLTNALGTTSASTVAVTTTAIMTAVGAGSIAYAYVAADTATPACNQVYVAIQTGGTSTFLVTKAVTSHICVVMTATTGTNLAGASFAATVGNVWFERGNGTYYVSYTVTKAVEVATATAGSVVPVAGASGVTAQVYSYLQGVLATSAGTLLWATVPVVYTGTITAAAGTPSPTAAQVMVMCGSTLYQNSTTFNCAYKDAAAGGTANVKLVVVAADGTVGSATTIATDSTAGTVSTSDYLVKTWTVAGFLYADYPQQGILLNNLTTAGATPTYSNNLNIYNLTTGATAATGATAGGLMVASSWTNAINGAAFGGAGLSSSKGYMVYDQYMSTDATPDTYTFEYGAFYNDTTVKTAKTTLATTTNSAYGNPFIDANGSLWFGAYTVDYGVTPSILLTGQLGKVLLSVYSAGNVLASVVALLSFIVAALFAF